MKAVIFITLLLMISACKPRSTVEDHRAVAAKEKLVTDTPFNQMESGYKGTREAMTEFLRCWKAEVRKDAVDGASPPAVKELRTGNHPLPPSVLHFHAVAAELGFKSLYDLAHDASRFIAPESVRLFSEFSPEDYKLWSTAYGGIGVPDEKYYRYDKTQGSGGRLRGNYLSRMLVVGAEQGGAHFLIIPNEISKDGEYEAQILHHGGLIVRFKSFAHLLAHLYLEEREKLAGRDSSLGHLYYYPGVLAETCVRHILVS